MKALVIGSARSGTAVTKLLVAQGYDCTIVDLKKVTDSEALQKLGVRVYEGCHPILLLEESFDLIVKNPGIPHLDPYIEAFRAKGHFIANEIEVASQLAPQFRYGAITGTNGKTTTTSLLEAMLKADNPDNIGCGNIGLPLSEVVALDPQKTRTIALEIAAFQLLGCQSFHPQVSVILNLTPDHLDVFPSIDDYYQAKCRVFQSQTGDDWFLRNLDDKNIERYCTKVPCRQIGYSMVKQADVCIQAGWVTLFGQPVFEVKTLKLKGRHNIQNAMVASVMAVKLGVPVQTIRKVIEQFTGVEHRLEFVRRLNDVDYYNDSKGTTAESTLMALRSFDSPVILLAGGYDKKTGFEVLRPELSKIKTLIAFGATKDQFKSLYAKTILVETMVEALNLSHQMAKPGDVVLFSPACASYDQFNNYEERGRLFKEAVHQL